MLNHYVVHLTVVLYVNYNFKTMAIYFFSTLIKGYSGCGIVQYFNFVTTLKKITQNFSDPRLILRLNNLVFVSSGIDC